jgi:hypothetical protein
MSIQLGVERGTPYTYTLLVAERDTPCMSIPLVFVKGYSLHV